MGTYVFHKERIWIWIRTGNPVVFKAWHPGQPDNLYGFQNFLGLYHDFGFEWDDLRCCGVKGLSGSYKPICQKVMD